MTTPTLIPDQADQIAANAGREDDRSFDEILTEMEHYATTDELLRLADALRYAFSHLSPRQQEHVTEMLRE